MYDKEHIAIERLRVAAEMSEHHYGKPLAVTVSGGKDSDVCLELARRAAGKGGGSWRTGLDVYRWWMGENPEQVKFWGEEC